MTRLQEVLFGKQQAVRVVVEDRGEGFSAVFARSDMLFLFLFLRFAVWFTIIFVHMCEHNRPLYASSVVAARLCWVLWIRVL